MPWTRAVVVGGWMLLPFATATAQTSEPSRFSVAAGVGRAFPLESYYDNAFAWHASGRFRTRTPVSLEVTFDRWVHELTRVRKDVTFYGREGVIIGHADEVRIDNEVAVYILSVNAMVGGTVDRATITGSIGPALVTQREDYLESLTGCNSSTPERCAGSSSRRWQPTLGVHGAFDLGFQMTSRLSAFTRVTLSSPVYGFPGAGHVNLVGGVRVRPK